MKMRLATSTDTETPDMKHSDASFSPEQISLFVLAIRVLPATPSQDT